MKKYPNITVKTSYSMGWLGKIRCPHSFATGTAPDVNQINWNWIASFSSDGSAFYDLNKLSDILDLSQFSEDYLATVYGSRQTAGRSDLHDRQNLLLEQDYIRPGRN